MEIFYICLVISLICGIYILLDCNNQYKQYQKLEAQNDIEYFGKVNKYDAFDKCEKIITSCKTVEQIKPAKEIVKLYYWLYEDYILTKGLEEIYFKKEKLIYDI